MQLYWYCFMCMRGTLQGDDWPLSVIIIIIIIIITFMQGFYNYVPETNHVSQGTLYSTAAIL